MQFMKKFWEELLNNFSSVYKAACIQLNIY